MYFIFRHKILQWNQKILQARIVERRVQIKPHWWDSVPLKQKLECSFTVNHNAPAPDNFFTGTILNLYSKRLVECFRDAGVLFETFPAEMLDAETRIKLPLEYELFHLLEMYSGLNEELSDYDDIDIRRLVLTEDCLKQNRMLFRLQEHSFLVLIHHEMKLALDKMGITGCEYIPVEEFEITRERFRESLKNWYKT